MNTINKVPPFKGWVIQNFPFIEADFDAITNYQLYCKVVEYLNKVIVNENELTTAMNYVLNYFNNLDVQEEINNKLDEMAESGQLTDIIAQYLNLAGVLAYNTISSMASALNIAEGSTCYTLGQNTYNDGKGAFYKIRTITSSDVVDGFNIVALDVSNTLIAERIPNYYINQLNTNVTNLQTAVNLLTNKKYLFVGDSYATGYQGSDVDPIEGFFTKVKNDLNLDATIVAENGYGFLGISGTHKWKTLLENTTISDKSSYTDIIICGGMNDNGQEYNDLRDAMNELFTYLKSNFVNAIIHVGFIGKYRLGQESSLINIRKAIKYYQGLTTNYGHKYINNSELILHNMNWFISDNIHPNTKGENQLAQAIKQYILTNQILYFTDVSDNNTYQIDTISPESNISVSNLTLYSNMETECCTFYISGAINFTNAITLNNLTDVTIGTLTSSYICGSAYNQGLNEYVEGYVYSTTQINGSNFVKVGFRLYNDSNNKIHLKAFTVMDNGNLLNLTINQISFPYGVIKCSVLSRYC